jgi:Subtilase family
MVASAAFGATLTPAIPRICESGAGWSSPGERAPQEVRAYIESLGGASYNQRAACGRWGGTWTEQRTKRSQGDANSEGLLARFIMYPPQGSDVRQLAVWLSAKGQVRGIERAHDYLVVSFTRRLSGERLGEILFAQQVGYSEPDCDGPDFMMTSNDLLTTGLARDCWHRSARTEFPNDPCMDELWGHASIGWDSRVAARSLPRMVAVLDSGIDASHEDLKRNVVARSFGHSLTQSDRLNARCATSGRCYSHGTEMAGTIGGRMDNGIGVVGVAPNSLMLPIVISSVDQRQLARLSTIAQGIEEAARSGADIINISAKWPVDSRAISEAILAAVGGDAARRRLVITGYTTTLQTDDTVREHYPSRYRCLPGVLAAVPTDMRGRNLSNPKGRPSATDGRIQAPGVDIVVTTTDDSYRGYTLSEAAGPSSAAAYVSGSVALVWGSPPLNKCDAQQIKELLFCRSKSSASTRYPWINVDFLRELANVDPESDCGSAMAALGCS